MSSTDVRPDEQSSAHTGVTPVASVAASAPPLRQRARAALARILNRYPELPPAPGDARTRRIALAAVTMLALAFVTFFTAYLWALHDAYLTHAEDLGIMDQAIWNTVHGAPLHQTICNIVGDANCLGDVSRLAIHFEPIMFPISLLYLVVPSPKTLQFLQVLVVAAGAFPAYWIASRRLRSQFAGVIFAAVYLLFPALQAAVTYDFHAVTLSAAFLMFALYFMLTRNNVGLFIACLLALSTKEEIVVDVALIGMSVALLQRRWRVGAGLVALSIGWLIMELAIMHAASPLGHSPTAGRYAYLGHSPAQAALFILTHPITVLREAVLDPAGIYYLRTLLSPGAYLPLLSPLTLLIAVPALAINLLSSDPTMHSGLYHYNAEIVPVLILATIESVALLASVGAWLTGRVAPVADRAAHAIWPGGRAWWSGMRRVPVARVVVVGLTLFVLVTGLYEQRGHGYLPLARGFTWPEQTAHSRLANDIIGLIPPNASVSAQSDLVPHLSHRRFVYLYPFRAEQSDYVFLDVTGNLYPYTTEPVTYLQTVQALLSSHADHVVAAKDGYLLLAKGPGTSLNPTDPNGLPETFYSFTHLPASQMIPHPLEIRFGSALELVGYSVTPPLPIGVNTYITVTTYWRVTAPLVQHTQYTPQLLLIGPDGAVRTFQDFATVQWRPMNTWQPGETLVVRSWPIFIGSANTGGVRLGMRVSAAAPGGTTQPLAATLDGPAGTMGSAPALLDGGTGTIFADAAVTR